MSLEISRLGVNEFSILVESFKDYKLVNSDKT